MLLRSDYQTATAAKIFKKINNAKKDGKKIEEDLYSKAKEYYEQAFYRVLFVGAENSVGFHNPSEAMRILGDAISFASKSESYLRQIASNIGLKLEDKIDLELEKYLNNKGDKKLNFDRSVEFKDSFKIQEHYF